MVVSVSYFDNVIICFLSKTCIISYIPQGSSLLTFDHVVQVRTIVLWIVAAQVAFWSRRRPLHLVVTAQTARPEHATGIGRSRRQIARWHKPRLTSLKNVTILRRGLIRRKIYFLKRQRFRNNKIMHKEIN